ncbi:MAG TPA: 1-acyl-sn-glycerol-3-phosphate acyltransferase [Flavobacteriales bacterium]|nr:1-acyl-sn-glycerol-3-phosphate acyltransferase [Flavobacteriales bacterium]
MEKKYKPKVTGKGWAYFICYFWFTPFLWSYWKRREFHGLENVPKDKPVFLTPNHINALIEPLGLSPIVKLRMLTFLLRAGAFKKKSVNKIFYQLNMLPIYRQLDGNDQLDKNNEVYQNCVWLLEKKRPILIFPEGSHSLVKRLRPFKKGLLRFAFGAEDKNGFSLDVHLVPIGISYNDLYNFGGDKLINIGKPLRLADYKALYETNPARAMNELKRDLEKAVGELMVNISSDDYYHEIDELRSIAINRYRLVHNLKTNLLQEFNYGKKIIAEAETRLFADENIAPVLKAKINRYNKIISTQKLRDMLVDPLYKFMSPVLWWPFLILVFPLFAVGFAINWIPFYMPRFIAKKTVKDPAFQSSILWLSSMLLFTILYLLIFVLTGLISGSWLWAYAAFGTGVVTAAITLFYRRKWNKFFAERRFRKFAATADGKEALVLRKEILSYVNHVE